MWWSSRIPILLFVALVTGCRIDVGDAREEAATAPADTFGYRCTAGPILAADSVLAAPGPIERLPTIGDDLLAVVRGGHLVRLDPGPGTAPPLLSGGKDFDTRNGVVARLSRERIELFGYARGRVTGPRRAIAVEPYELSLALGRRTIWLHSPADPANVLVTARDRRSGERTMGILPLERSFLRLLLEDPDALLSDAGVVRTSGDAAAFVPAIRDPVVLRLGDRPRALFLGHGERGHLRTVARVETLAGRPCPGCVAEREVTARQEIRRLYADAVFDGGALWVLRLVPAGSTAARLIRVASADPDPLDVRAWDLAGLTAAPTALGVVGDRIAVADGDLVRFYPLPEPPGGAPCAPYAVVP